LALCGAVFLCLLVLPAQALVVTVDLGWGYGDGWTSGNAEANLISGYNLQEGSIVQVVMFNSATASDPGTDTDDNFDTFSTYSGADISAEPYPGTEPSHVPSDTAIYFPDTVPIGHTLAYSTQIGSAIDGGVDGYWYNIYEQFEILGTYDSLYIRVFGATDFDQGVVISSYWGNSPVEVGEGIVGTWFVDPIDNTVAGHTNYFEVIPEPGTVALLLLGAPALLAGYRRRRTRN
jgi:PEP-CTERM motif